MIISRVTRREALVEEGLRALLADSVNGGASVGFLAPLSDVMRAPASKSREACRAQMIALDGATLIIMPSMSAPFARPSRAANLGKA